MKNKYKKLLTISTSIIIIVIFSIIYTDLNSKSITPRAYGGSLASSNVVDPSVVIIDSQVSSDVAFLTTLIGIKNIKLDTSFFNSQSFKELKDNSIRVGQATPGRINPFSPIGGNENNVSPLDVVVTDQSSDIIDNTN